MHIYVSKIHAKPCTYDTHPSVLMFLVGASGPPDLKRTFFILISLGTRPPGPPECLPGRPVGYQRLQTAFLRGQNDFWRSQCHRMAPQATPNVVEKCANMSHFVPLLQGPLDAFLAILPGPKTFALLFFLNWPASESPNATGRAPGCSTCRPKVCQYA